MIYCRQAHIKIVASQSNANPDKKNVSYYISTLICYVITTLVTHNKTNLKCIVIGTFTTDKGK